MSTAYFIHSVREDIYIYGSTSLDICRYAVRAFYLFILLVKRVFSCLLFSNEVAFAAPKTVIHFLSKVAILFA